MMCAHYMSEPLLKTVHSSVLVKTCTKLPLFLFNTVLLPSVGVTRNSPTFIAFHVLAFTFDAKGALNMKLRSDLSKVKLKYLEEVDLGGIGVHVAGHIKEDQECPHTLGADDVAAYCEQEDKKL